jgi:hypothetical protein
MRKLIVILSALLIGLTVGCNKQQPEIESTQEPVSVYEEQQVVPVYKEVQADGDIIFEYGNISDEFYFYTIVNVEQGIYEYYFPAMHMDWPIVCDSLEDLNSVIDCHIEQAYPNGATFNVFTWTSNN